MKKILLAALLLLLVGCATEPVVVYRTQVVAASDTMLRDCAIEAPPTKDAYLKADTDQREKMLQENIQAHIKNAALCNSRIGEVRSWNKQQKDLYEDKSILPGK